MISGVRPSGPGSSAGSPIGSRAQRIEVGGQVAVHAEGLHQRHRRGHVVEHLRRDRAGARPGLAAPRAPAAAIR